MELKQLGKINIKLRDFALNTIKYQKFRTDVALQKFEYQFTKSTAKNYFEAGIRYLRTKIVSKTVSKLYFKYLDEYLKQHIQPLTPSEEDKRREMNRVYFKKEAVLPVTNVAKELMKDKLTETFEYGVRVKDTVKVFKSKEDAMLFLSGVCFATEHVCNVRLVSVQNLGETNE